MYFVGVDLAPTEHDQTGIAVAEADGRLVHLGTASSDADVQSAVAPYVADDCLVAVADGPRAEALAREWGLALDESSTRRALLVSPHAAAALFGVDASRAPDVGRRKRDLLALMTHLEELDAATPRLRVNRNITWVELRKRVEAATRAGQLDRDGDPVDAVVCAYVALCCQARPQDVTITGSRAAVLAPAHPSAQPRPTMGTRSAVQEAVEKYAARRPALVEACDRYLRLVRGLLDDAGINYLSVTARTKTVESFAGKATRTAGDRAPFGDPLSEITDQIGLRVITYLRDDVATVATLLGEELRLLEDRDWGAETAREGRWGYASRHLLVGIEGEQQPASIQIRTVLQHAWAEFEHDIRYKGSIPAAHGPDLDRRFTLAAGLLELADGEFSAIRERLRGTGVDAGAAEETDTSDPRIVTPVLATYLGNRYADAGWSRTDHYGWISGLLLELGITSLAELTAVLDQVDEVAVNRAMDYRYPAGAVRRLDDALLARFGDRYLALHGNAHRKDLLRTRFDKITGDHRRDSPDR